MIDIDKILKESAFYDDFYELEKDIVKNSINEAIKQAVPVILKEVSEKANLSYRLTEDTDVEKAGFKFVITKDSILSLEQELIQKLLKNE